MPFSIFIEVGVKKSRRKKRKTCTVLAWTKNTTAIYGQEKAKKNRQIRRIKIKTVY